MAKTLTVSMPDSCNGCELCILEVQRQQGKIGIDGSFVRIFREAGSFKVEIDPQIVALDNSKIQKICPKDVFTLKEGNEFFN